MTDPLVTEYLPMLRGHVVNKYRWMEQRGNCLITVDDLVQVASIVLLGLADKWDDWLAQQGKTREGNNRLFWSFLETEVKGAVIKYYQRQGKDGAESRDASFDSSDAVEAYLEGDARTAVRARRDKESWTVTRDDIVDFFQVMPLKDKLYIALRYFDEIPTAEAAALVGTSEKTYTNQLGTFRSRWRAFAINQVAVSAELVDVPTRVEVGWTPPAQLVDYVRDRHRADLAEYVWYVSECFRQDVGYLAAVLGTERRVSAGHAGATTSVTPAQRYEIDHMLSQGFNCAEIARQTGASYAAVLWTRDHPALVS